MLVTFVSLIQAVSQPLYLSLQQYKIDNNVTIEMTHGTGEPVEPEILDVIGVSLAHPIRVDEGYLAGPAHALRIVWPAEGAGLVGSTLKIRRCPRPHKTQNVWR